MLFWGVSSAPPKLGDFLLNLSLQGPPFQISPTNDMAMIHLSLIFCFFKTYTFGVLFLKRSAPGELTDFLIVRDSMLMCIRACFFFWFWFLAGMGVGEAVVGVTVWKRLKSEIY